MRATHRRPTALVRMAVIAAAVLAGVAVALRPAQAREGRAPRFVNIDDSRIALSEENIPAPASVASPMPSPAGAAGVAPSGAQPAPAGGAGISAPAYGATIPPGAAPIGAQGGAARTEFPPTIDLTGAVATEQISDGSLVSQFAAAASNPARAASIRTVERARLEIIAGRADNAIRLLSRALSIDPSNPFAYFYLGRAYMIKKNYIQALTFFQRSEIGLTSNPAWLGEACGFEGVAYEETGRLTEAASAYRRALQSAPSNRIALTGYGRLAAQGYGGVTDASLRGGAAPPPTGDSAIAPAPAMPVPPPPPSEPSPPAD
jgi:hypothetical protein